MRIALVSFRGERSRGGAERYTLDLACALADRGHEPVLLASSFDDSAAGVARVRIDATARSRAGRHLRFLDSLDDHLQIGAYDIVHAMLPVRRCDIYHPHAGIAAETLASGSPLTRIGNLLNRKRQTYARVERQLLEGTPPPVVLCLSELVKRQLMNCYRIDDARAVTLINGVDLERFDPQRHAPARQPTRARLGIGEDRIVALLISNNFALKGLKQAIEALKEVVTPGAPGVAIGQAESAILGIGCRVSGLGHEPPGTRVRAPQPLLLVVGRDDPAPYRKLAQSLGVADRVLFIGPTDDPASLYAAADFFILPTRRDSCALVVLEALAMGLPVISTAQNGACEVMRNGREGFVLDDPADVNRLAEAMSAMLDPQRRAAMRDACLALRPSLSWQQHVDRLDRLYAQIIAGR